MQHELMILTWGVALTLVQLVVAVLAGIAQVGLPVLAGNRDNVPAFTGLAGRAHRAHRNMLESLVLFAAVALAVVAAGRANAMTALGADLFLGGRAAYALLYLAGIPWLRTGAWGVAMAGLVLMLLQLV
ncbi:MAG: MAPEG family protein [Sphingomonas sp.]